VVQTAKVEHDALARLAPEMIGPKALKQLEKQLHKMKEMFLSALMLETGRTRDELLLQEYLPALFTIRWLMHAGSATLSARRIGSGFPLYFGKKNIWLKREPLGTVLVIGTWNYPLQINFRQILFALFAGNQVVFKPSPRVGATASVLEILFNSVDGWEDWVELIDASPEALDLVWPRVDSVVFTGSSRVGKLIAQKAAELSIPAIIEASGYDSVVTGVDTPEVRLIEHLVWAFTTHMGQTCVAPKILWIKRQDPANILGKIVTSLTDYEEHTAKTFFRALAEPEALQSEIFRRSAIRIGFDVAWQSQNGAVKVLRSETSQILRRLFTSDGFTLPFDATLLVVEYESIEEVLVWVNSAFGGLMVSTLGLTKKERQLIETGANRSVVAHNEIVVHAGDPAVAFGGRGISGIGYVGGDEHLLAMTRPKTIITASRRTRFALARWKQFDGREPLVQKFFGWLDKRH